MFSKVTLSAPANRGFVPSSPLLRHAYYGGEEARIVPGGRVLHRTADADGSPRVVATVIAAQVAINGLTLSEGERIEASAPIDPAQLPAPEAACPSAIRWNAPRETLAPSEVDGATNLLDGWYAVNGQWGTSAGYYRPGWMEMPCDEDGRAIPWHEVVTICRADRRPGGHWGPHPSTPGGIPAPVWRALGAGSTEKDRLRIDRW